MGISWSNNRRRNNPYWHHPHYHRHHPHFIPSSSYYYPSENPPPPSSSTLPPQNYVFATNAPYPFYPPPQFPPPPPYYFSSGYSSCNCVAPPQVGRPNFPNFQASQNNAAGWPPGPAIRPAVAIAVGQAVQPLPPMYVEHQNAKKVRNDVNVHKDTIKVEVDENHPDCYLVSFVFDAMFNGSITIYYFAKEEANRRFSPLFPEAYTPEKIHFQQGLGQKFCQPSGTGIDLGFYELDDLSRPSPDEDVFPLVICAETY
ncbi:hypothetical protein RJ641_021200 [Dillenia turbinata]|uniref:RING-type E3 ubiquitin transferase n=1 Tax=Dillenia turbinata TaxID=194707 RepID=A0AAN8UJF1_9MAGN